MAIKSIPLQDIKQLKLNNFLGVDYTQTKHLISPQRAVDMLNIINIDGVNKKRFLYRQTISFQKYGKINGVWNFKDSNGVNHCIVHCGKRIYKIKSGDISYENINLGVFREDEIIDITYSSTHCPEYYNNDFNSYYARIDSYIKDSRSFGVVRNNKLYLFVGIYLVYSNYDNNWELRIVQDNVDTYIPTTTIGISHVESNINVRSALDEVNLLSRRRKNLLIGENEDTKAELDLSNMQDTSIQEGNNELALYTDKILMGSFNERIPINNFEYLTIQLDYTQINHLQPITIELLVDKEELNSQTITLFNKNKFRVKSPLSITLEDILNAIGVFNLGARYFADEGLLEFAGYLGYNKTVLNETFNNLRIMAYGNKYGYQYILDAPIEENETIKVKLIDDNVELIKNVDFTCDYNRGAIYLNRNHRPLITGQSNIMVEFTAKTSEVDYNVKPDLINKCSFGIIFGYNEVQHLFVSGNEEHPNKDFHSTEITNIDTLTNESFEDFTYFGDLGSAVLGSNNRAIVSYLLLEDNTLAILKEYSHNEPSLYLRGAFLDDAVDYMGNVVLNPNGTPYKKVYYSQIASTIGEGAINNCATSQLSGDKLFLSHNGLYGLVLNSNIKSNERYAKERSRLINNRLTKVKNLKDAVSISYNGRYYLAVGDRVYIADSRHKFNYEGDMTDTFNYDWWVWENPKINVWFIYNDKLWCGTKDGRIIEMIEDSVLKYDTLIDSPEQITYGTDTQSFYYDSETLNLKSGDNIIINSTTRVLEHVANGIGFDPLDRTRIMCDEDDYFNYLRYLSSEDKVYINDNTGEYVGYILDNINDINDYSGYTSVKYVVFRLENGELYQYPVSGNCAISTDIKGINTIETFLDSETGIKTFKILSKGSVINTELGLFNEDNNTSYDNEEVFITKHYKKIIYTGSLFLRKVDKKPINSVWLSPHLSCGTIDYSKTSQSITLLPASIEGGEVIFKVFTKDNEHLTNIEGIDIWNTADIDLNNFSFETSYFTKSFTKKLKVRNFNFIQFYYSSPNERDCIIHEISLLYVITKKNKGVK